jgi:serine phosphatase RsbU (regulator of sigma subunit)
MASDRKRGRKDQPAEEALPVAEPVAEERGKDRGGKKGGGGGGGFPGAIPVGAGLVAGVLAFAGAFVVGGQMAPKDPYESLDAGGVQAARMLAAMDIDRWRVGFGTSSGVRRKAKEETSRRIKEAGGADDIEQFKEAVAKWYIGDSSPGSKWRPGLDMFFPDKDPADELAKKARDEALSDVEKAEPGAFVGAMILEKDGNPLIVHPDGQLPPTPPGDKLVRTAGLTQVYEASLLGKSVHWYQHPMHARTGTPEGSCVVILSTGSVKAFPLAAAAAAAGGLAFLGGMIAAMVLAGGAKNSLARLASDTDAVAKGHFDTKLSIGGPSVVQHVAKNVQKIAALAASGAAAPAQVMVQEVVRAPVQEINESLAPTKSFERPDELEVEATQKVSAEVGNDYYDVVNVDADHVGVFIADAPVRGVKSAMLMASIRALFRANYKGQTSPAELLKLVNRGFAVDLPRGSYVTATYAVVNKTTGACKFANAQHLPLVFWKLAKKASARVASEGIALGLDPGPVFDKTIAEKAIPLEKGDRIILYTDGAINAKNAAGAQYGEERFYYVVNREAPKNSAACVNFVANDVDLFHEGAPLMDDFTLVTVRKLR